MTKYFYDTKVSVLRVRHYVTRSMVVQDTVYSSWTDSQMRDWLIEHNILKSDAQVQREKLQKLIADHYANARDTVWGGWGESDMRQWLVEHGYIDDRSAAGKKKDELVALMSDKYVYFCERGC